MKVCGAFKAAGNSNVVVKIGLIAALGFMIALLGRTEAGFAAEKSSETTSKGLISILRILDFSKVGLSVKTQPQFQVLLRDRALARLRKNGLQPVDISFKGPVQALLVLTIDPIPLNDACSGKVLYDTKLELQDDISLKRDPQITLQRVTWSLAPGHPTVVDTVSLDALLIRRRQVYRSVHCLLWVASSTMKEGERKRGQETVLPGCA